MLARYLPEEPYTDEEWECCHAWYLAWLEHAYALHQPERDRIRATIAAGW
jgi:hypothetical protein